jgi:hypothetical protein
VYPALLVSAALQDGIRWTISAMVQGIVILAYAS